MKLPFASLVVLAVAAAPHTCNKVKTPTCYKGRLEVKGICGNYTIAVTEGNLAGVQASWTDEQTGKTYRNVFRPASSCLIPEELKEGDTFYFVADASESKDCAVCMAYYPAPEKKIGIRVLPGQCSTIK